MIRKTIAFAVLIIAVGMLLLQPGITGHTIWNPEFENITITGPTTINLSVYSESNAEYLLAPSDTILLSLENDLLTITPNSTGNFPVEITASRNGSIETLELLIIAEEAEIIPETPSFIQQVQEGPHEARFWNYSTTDKLEVELSHTSTQAQSVWAENATLSADIAQPQEHVVLTMALNSTAKLHIGIEGAEYRISTIGMEPSTAEKTTETLSQISTPNETSKLNEGESVEQDIPANATKVQTPRHSETLKTEKDETVAKKVEEDNNFDTHFINVTKDNETLTVKFYHDGVLAQPVWIEGEIAYNLSTETAQPHENVTLTVPLVKGKVPRFKLHVGAESEVFEFGITVINVQSYPVVGGEWEVRFTTEGAANLSIQGWDGTTWGIDLEFKSIKCGEDEQNTTFDGTKYVAADYTCDVNGTETSTVLTSGKHTLRFDFGDDVAYAFNQAENITLNLSISPLLQGYGENVTIIANVTKNTSQVDTIIINITRPNGQVRQFSTTGTNVLEVQYFDFLNGTYDVTAFANLTDGNQSIVNGTFNLTAIAISNIRTDRDVYNQSTIVRLFDVPFVNLTDVKWRLGALGNFSPANIQADIVWIVDRSGSMLPIQEAIANASQAFTDELANSGINFSLAVVCYLDSPTLQQSFTDDRTEFNDAVTSCGSSGGVENGLRAMNETIDQLGLQYRTDAKKVFVLVSNEGADDYFQPAGDITDAQTGPFPARLSDVQSRLLNNEVSVFGIVDRYDVLFNYEVTEYLDTFALTGGSNFQRQDTDFSTLMEGLAEDIGRAVALQTRTLNGSSPFREFTTQEDNKTAEQIIDDDIAQGGSEFPNNFFQDQADNIESFVIRILNATGNNGTDNISVDTRLISAFFVHNETGAIIDPTNVSGVRNSTIQFFYPNESFISKIQNNASPVNLTGKLVLTVERLVGTDFIHHFTVLNDTTTTDTRTILPGVPFELLLKPIWDGEGGFPTSGSPSGKYRARARLYDRNGTTLLVDSQDIEMDTTYNFTIVGQTFECPINLEESFILQGTFTGNGSGYCFNLTKDSITLDCDGQLINTSLEGDTAPNKNLGAVISNNKTGLTVTNCTITNWNRGIYLVNVTDSQLDNNVIQKTNESIIGIFDSRNIGITGSALSTVRPRRSVSIPGRLGTVIIGRGINTERGANTTIFDTTISSNDENAARFVQNDNSSIRSSTISNEDRYSVYVPGRATVQFFRSNNGLVKNSEVTSTSNRAINIQGLQNSTGFVTAKNFTIQNNTISGGGDSSLYLQIADNTIFIDNFIPAEWGVLQEGGNGNQFINNTFNSTEAFDINPRGGQHVVLSATNTTIRGNSINSTRAMEIGGVERPNLHFTSILYTANVIGIHIFENTLRGSSGIRLEWVNDSTVRNNTLNNSGHTSISVIGRLSLPPGGRNASVLDNTVTSDNVNGAGIRITDGMVDSTVANNTIISTGDSIEVTNECINITISGNNITVLADGTSFIVGIRTGASNGAADDTQDILIKNNRIDSNGTTADGRNYGIYNTGGRNIDIINNTVLMRRAAFAGIRYALKTARDRDVIGNNVTLLASGNGIKLERMQESRIDNNTVRLIGGSGDAILQDTPGGAQSSNVTYNNNHIRTSGSSVDGIILTCETCEAGRNNITINGTSKSEAIGLNRGGTAYNNTIRAFGNANLGISIQGSSLFNVTVANNTVTTTGSSSHGISNDNLAVQRTGDKITNNTVSTSGSSSIGILVARQDNSEIQFNTINTSGTSSNGLQLNSLTFHSALNNLFEENTITVKEDSNAIDINGNADNNRFINNRIAALGTGDEWNTGDTSPDNNTAINLTFTRTNVLVSELSTENTTGIKGVLPTEAELLGLPPGQAPLNKYFNFTGISQFQSGSKSIIRINVTYTDAEFAATLIGNEDGLRVWRFNQTTWENESFFDLNTADSIRNIVSVTVRNFSTFGIFGPTPVTLQKTASDTTVLPGQTLNYTITAVNNAANLSNISIIDTLPTEIIFLSAQPPPNSTTGQQQQWNFTELNSGENIKINITVQINRTVLRGDELTNIIEFSADNGTAPIETNDTEIVNAVSPVITLTKNVTDSTPLPNTIINYTITVNNTGDETLFNFTVTDVLPENLTFLSATPTPNSTNPLQWNFTSLTAGTVEIILVSTLVNESLLDGDKLTNIVNVTGIDGEGNNLSNSTNLTANISTARVQILVTASNNTILPNATVNLTIQITNIQNKALNVTVGQQIIPSGLTFVNSTIPQVSPDLFEILNLLPGASSSFQVTVRSNFSLPDPTNLTVVYNATGTEALVATPTVNDSETITYISIPSATISLTSTEATTTPTTNANLLLNIDTSDASNDKIKNITTWFVDGQALQVLYLGFEAGSTTATSARDYALSNTANVDGATFNKTAGFDGFGALDFDGVDDFVTVPDSNDLDVEEFTITLYVKDPVSGLGEEMTITEVTGTTSYNAEGCPSIIGGSTFSGVDDGIRGPFNLGFDFQFFNQTIAATDDVFMDTNGRLMFDSDSSDYTPSDSEMQNDNIRIIAPVWDDYGGGSLNNEFVCVNKGTAPNRFAVFRWDSEWYNGNGIVQPEVVIFETGRILLRYDTVDNSPSDGQIIKGVSLGNGQDYNYTNLFHQSGPQPSTLDGRSFELRFEGVTPTRTVVNKNGSYALQIIGPDGNFTLQGFVNGDNTTRVESSIDKNMTFVALSYDGNDLKLYKNGVLADSRTLGVSITATNNNLTIGNNLLGVIDDLVIYNRALSAEQIDLLWQNRTDTIHSKETQPGETWFARVTPNDDPRDGATVQSNNVVIQSPAPPPGGAGGGGSIVVRPPPSPPAPAPPTISPAPQQRAKVLRPPEEVPAPSLYCPPVPNKNLNQTSVVCACILQGPTIPSEMEAQPTALKDSIPEGHELIAKPFNWTCDRDSIDFSMSLPDNYEDITVQRCLNGSCQEVKTYFTEELYCRNKPITQLQKNLLPEDEILPQELPVLEPQRKMVTPQENDITIGPLTATFLHFDEPFTVTLSKPFKAVPSPHNPSLMLVTPPIRLHAEEYPEGTQVHLEYKLAEDGYIQGTQGVWTPKNKTWKKLSNKTTWQGPLQDTLLTGVMARKCDACDQSELVRKYDGGSTNAIVLIHGLMSSSTAWEPLMAEVELTKQDWQVWTFGYPQELTLEEASRDLASLLNQHEQEFDNILLAGHSMGGLIVQQALRYSKDGQAPSAYLPKVKGALLIGSPNEGSVGLQEYKHLLQYVTTSRSDIPLFDIEVPMLQTAIEGKRIPRVEGIKYYALAGTKGYEVEIGGIRQALSQEGTDGLVSIESATTIGETGVENMCKDYFQVHTTHTGLVDDVLPRKVLSRIAAITFGEEGKPGVLGFNTYTRARIDNCNPEEVFLVTGRKTQKPMPLAQCTCGDNICGADESPETCPADCAIARELEIETCTALQATLYLLLILVMLLTGLIEIRSHWMKAKVPGTALATTWALTAGSAGIMTAQYFLCQIEPIAAIAISFATLVLATRPLHRTRHHKVQPSPEPLSQQPLPEPPMPPSMPPQETPADGGLRKFIKQTKALDTPGPGTLKDRLREFFLKSEDLKTRATAPYHKDLSKFQNKLEEGKFKSDAERLDELLRKLKKHDKGSRKS